MLARLRTPRTLFATFIVIGLALSISWGYRLGTYCEAARDDRTPEEIVGKQRVHETARYESPQWPEIRSILGKGATQRRESVQATGPDKEPWTRKFFCDAKFADVAIVYFTWCLIGVGVFQAYYLWNTVKATSDAAAALPKIERAYLFVERVIGDMGGTSTFRRADGIQVSEQSVYAQVVFKNHGRTPGVLIDALAGVRLCRSFDELPLIEMRRLVAPGRVVGSGDECSASRLEYRVDAEGAKSIVGGSSDLMLILFGRAEYLDVLGVKRKIEFCRVYDRQVDSWALANEGNTWT